VFQWNPAYSVNIGSIDAQHRSLLTIGGELCHAISTGQGKAAQIRILDHLSQFLAMHFAHEERLMKTHGYPALAAHQAEHGVLAARVVRFRDDVEAGRAAVSNEVLDFLKDSLVSHFQGSDSKYSPFVRKEGVA
jgi:hemerythrin-like metal-binding protein